VTTTSDSGLLPAIYADGKRASAPGSAETSRLNGGQVELIAPWKQARFRAKNRLDNRGGTGKVPPIDMKNDPLTTALLGALLVSALLSLVFFERLVANTRELRTINTQVAYINNMNNNRALLNSLANDAVEYSKKNKDIDPLLESFGLKPGKSASATTNKPATK
jgi:hypothetical protein